MEAAVVKLYIKKSGRDLSERVESMRYEECLYEDDLVEFNIKAGYAHELADDEDIRAGVIIQFQFGYMGGAMSSVKTARITDIKMVYGSRIKLTIKALDLGNFMKKSSSQTVWKDMSSEEVVRKIADKWGLSVDIDTTNTYIKSLAQSNKSDFELLQSLVAKEDNGNYMFYVSNGKVVYKKKSTVMKATPRKLFTYGDGTNVISFEPTMKESNKDGGGTKTVATNIDPFSMEIVKGEADTETVKDDTTLGVAGVAVDAFGGEIKKHIPVPLASEAPKKDAESKANATKKKGTAGGLTGKLVTKGEPTLSCADLITMAGVAKVHSGNWMAVKCVHDIQGGYKTTFDLTKNGTSKPTKSESTTNEDVNNKMGEKEAKGKKKVGFVDAYGNESGFNSIM